MHEITKKTRNIYWGECMCGEYCVRVYPKRLPKTSTLVGWEVTLGDGTFLEIFSQIEFIVSMSFHKLSSCSNLDKFFLWQDKQRKWMMR